LNRKSGRRIRQARVQFRGVPTSRSSFNFALSFERNNPGLLDASIKYDMSQRASLTMGQFKLPFSRESLTSSKSLDLMDRPYFINQFRPPNARDVGIMFTLKPANDLCLELGTFNGAGKSAVDTNDQPILAGRLSGGFSLGEIRLEPEAAFIHARAENGSQAPLELYLQNVWNSTSYNKSEKHVGLATFYRDYSLKYEYMQGRFKPLNPVLNTVISDGMSLTLGKKVSRFTTLHVRFENFDSDIRTTTVDDISWITCGVSHDLSDNLRLKLNYVAKSEAVNSDSNNQGGIEMVAEF